MLLMVITLTVCNKNNNEDIIILYTNDVHCAIDENIGYAGLASYKNKLLRQTPYVSLVDCGDAIQGNVIGTISKGEYLLQLMSLEDF